MPVYNSEKGCVEVFLRAVFCVVNWLLLFTGLGLIGYSIFLGVEVGERESRLVLVNDFQRSLLSDGDADANDGDADDGDADDDDETVWEKGFHWWFVGFVGMAGLWITLASAIALFGAKFERPCLLGTHTVLTLISLLAETALALVFKFVVDGSLNKLAPLDESGGYKALRDFVTHHVKLSLYVGLAIVGLQVITLLVGCALWSFAAESRLDEDEEAEIWRRPLLSSGNGDEVESGIGKKKDDPWSRRMREKYGLDTGRFSYDPDQSSSLARSRPPERELNRGEPDERRCSLM